ncbi:MAG: hypothetical protein ACPG31_10220 [Planctomycetota bacterium]
MNIHRQPLFRLLALLLTILFGADVAAAQKPFEEVKRKTLIEAASRHLELGVWCRDRGMTAQATTEFLTAVEVSEGAHPGASRLVQIMRSLDEKFWKKHKKPARSSIKSYAKKSVKARHDDQEDRLDLAKLADKRKMEDLAEAEYEGILRRRNAALDFDKKGGIMVEAGTIPEKYASRFKERAVAINDLLYLREGVLEYVPDLKEISEYQDDVLRVRGSLELEQLKELHAITLALLPHLEEDRGARPSQRLHLFFFATRKNYEAYCDASEHASHRLVDGFAMSRGLTAVICAEDLSFPDLQAVTLHETAHLFHFGTSRAVMPSWYNEGYAETFGAQESFSWDGKSLEVAGMMAPHRLAGLKDPAARFTLAELLEGKALELFGQDRERAHLFYAQSWTLMRFLREGAEDEVQEAYDLWEASCLGAAIGAKVGDLETTDASEANAWFRGQVAMDFAKLEQDYSAWLETQLP